MDENESESSGLEVTASIGSGLGSIVDGVVDVAKGGAAAVRDTAYLVGDAAETAYHSFAAGADATIGDMKGATAHNDAANAEAREIREDASNIASDIGF